MAAGRTNSFAIMASGESSRWSTLSLEPRLVDWISEFAGGVETKDSLERLLKEPRKRFMVLSLVLSGEIWRKESCHRVVPGG